MNAQAYTPTHQVLPQPAIAQLVQAARTPIPEHDPLARVKAIEKATQRVKSTYPEKFQPTTKE